MNPEKPLFFGMDGKPIDPMGDEMRRLFETPGARIVEQTPLASGRFVSTVLLIVDHNFVGHGPPIIFETMVFPSRDDLSELACERYATVEEARQGHWRLVAEWGGRTSDDLDPEES